MIILPAIDIKDGNCVRLFKGDFSTVEKVASDYLETAKGFEAAGSEWIHMVDLDGAKEGRPVNTKIYTDVAEKTNLKVELGGGIRSLETIDEYLKMGITRVILGSVALKEPEFVKDATDRNRTSPFAFTGNKFEFRMVGSSDSIGSPNTILNAIVAEAFCEAADILEQADNFELAVHDLIKEYMTKHQRIIFNGDGYSQKWIEEAARRGLPNIKTTVEAVDALLAKVRDTQTENIIKAGNLIAESVANGGCIYLSGIVHGIELDLIYRGGGPIFYKHFTYKMEIDAPARKRDNSDLGYERQTLAAARYALQQSNFRPGDVLFVSSVSGRTAHVVDLAYEAVQMGIKVIAFEPDARNYRKLEKQ